MCNFSAILASALTHQVCMCSEAEPVTPPPKLQVHTNIQTTLTSALIHQFCMRSAAKVIMGATKPKTAGSCTM